MTGPSASDSTAVGGAGSSLKTNNDNTSTESGSSKSAAAPIAVLSEGLIPELRCRWFSHSGEPAVVYIASYADALNISGSNSYSDLELKNVHTTNSSRRNLALVPDTPQARSSIDLHTSLQHCDVNLSTTMNAAGGTNAAPSSWRGLVRLYCGGRIETCAFTVHLGPLFLRTGHLLILTDSGIRLFLVNPRVDPESGNFFSDNLNRRSVTTTVPYTFDPLPSYSVSFSALRNGLQENREILRKIQITDDGRVFLASSTHIFEYQYCPYDMNTHIQI